METIKILWSGCPSCKRLEENVKLALEKIWLDVNIEKVTDLVEIMSYWVMWTPALVFDEKVVSYWKVNEIDEIIDLINKNI